MSFKNLDIKKFEERIKKKISKDNDCRVDFKWTFFGSVEFQSDNLTKYYGDIELHVTTKNPKHNTTFLLHKIKRPINDFIVFDKDKVVEPFCSMLNEVVYYIENKKHTTLYKVTWVTYSNKGISKIHNSYFYEDNIQNILDKIYSFHCESNKEQIKIHEIKIISDT